ncbi:MAG: hypothetical protein K2X07_12040 [Caulobacteraceae bacterium]|nr:hypothetical protein [Caulobacteraceae bacterium]
MSIALRTAAAFVLLAVAACAGGAANRESYTAQLDRLTDECRSRGGILTPNDLSVSGAQTSGAPERDFVCKINGQPSSRVRGA